MISKIAGVFLLVVTASGALAGCVTIDNKTQATETASMPGNTTIAETPFVEVTPSKVVETEIAPENGVIQIDLARAIYPPLSNVQEDFENGEYNTGLETIKKWVGVWEEMGVFKEIEIENNSLSPVPLDGKTKIVCVNTIKQGEYLGKMLCPPLDLVNGGLKEVPENGRWDETDKPLLITFERTEELVTRGSGSELVYQFMDKYVDTMTRYFDPKTGQIVEGRTVVSDIEVVENEIVTEGATGVSPEFLLEGNLKINEEAGRKYYEDFINSLAGNEQNRDYMVGLLGANPDGNKLMDYLRGNDYILPSGLNLPYERMSGYVRLGNNPIKEPIKLDALKIVVFGASQWNNNSSGVKEYVNLLNSTYGGLLLGADTPAVQYLGWAIDLKDNRLVMVAGAKETAYEEYPQTEKMTIGGYDGNFNFERDSAVASGELIQINKLLRVYSEDGSVYMAIGIFSPFICGIQESSCICDGDMTQLFGEGKTMFEPGK